jgi:hypothetical protein
MDKFEIGLENIIEEAKERLEIYRNSFKSKD